MEKFKNFIEKTFFWLDCARLYSLPMTILSWLVIFIYSVKNNGNVLSGIIALIGICFVHLATNLADDYFDYEILTQHSKFMETAQECKCKYLRTDKATTEELKKVIIIFLSIAAITGVILFFRAGYYVAVLALIALAIALGYQKLSLLRLGEVAVIIAYGPLMFEGVYYVMTKKFSYEVLILSFACVMFVNSVLYTHMLMDFDGDECAHKKTLCRKFKTKNSALNLILIFYLISYVLTGYLAVKTQHYYYFLPFITIPMVWDLYNSLKQFNNDKTTVPKIYPWHYPLDNWEELKTTPDAPFYFRFFYSRNITTVFMLLMCVAIILY